LNFYQISKELFIVRFSFSWLCLWATLPAGMWYRAVWYTFFEDLGEST
jgi:hypothetical protein